MKARSYLKRIQGFLIGFLVLNIAFSGVLLSKSSEVWNLSNANSFFVGREAKLEEIHAFFSKGKHILALTGGPGFGKTQIAKKYAQQFQKEYKLIWLIDVQQDIPSQFEKLALALNFLLSEKEKINLSTLSKEALIDRVKDILRMKNIPYLLIFDNAKTYDQIEKYIPYITDFGGSHILLTSRYANIWIDKVEIGKFERHESIFLIKKTLPKEKDTGIEKLANSLSDYPLGLTLAIGFIKSSPTATIDKYLSMHMKRTLKNSESRPSTILDQYSNDAQAALDISLRSIEEESKEASQVLFFMSLLNSKDVPETYIELWLKHMRSTLTADEAIKYIYDQSLIGVSETMEFDENRKPQNEEEIHYLSVHDLIHQLINEKISVEEKRKLIDTATTVLLEVFSGPTEKFRKKIINEPIHLLHAQKLCKNANEENYTTPKLLQLKVCVFECLMGLRDFETAKTILEEIEKDIKSGLQLEPYYEAVFAISESYYKSWSAFNYQETIRYLNRALFILNSIEEYKEERLRVIANLIQAYSLKGELDTAEQFVSKGKEIFQSSQSEVYNYLFLYAWAILLNDQGKFKEAEETFKKAKQYPSLEKDDPGIVHAILVQNAKALIKQGKLQEAWKVLQECEKKSLEFFQKRKNPALANILLFKSYIFIEEMNLSQAIKNLNSIFEIYKGYGTGGTKNRNQACAHFALGKVYKMKRNFTEALEQYLKSEEIFREVLTNTSIDDVSDLYKELAILGAKMKDEYIIHKYLGEHLKVFGHDHPRTLEILQYLDKKGISVPF